MKFQIFCFIRHTDVGASRQSFIHCELTFTASWCTHHRRNFSSQASWQNGAKRFFFRIDLGGLLDLEQWLNLETHRVGGVCRHVCGQ